jgi:hypothetical protein
MKTRIHWIHCGLLVTVAGVAYLALASDPAPTCCPPDLEAVSVSLNLAQAPAGSCVFVTNVVRNLSQTNSAGSSITKIYIYSDETMTEWSQHDLGVLAPGESVTFVSDLQIPPDLAPGNYAIVAECGLEVYESNETNNLASYNLTVTAGSPVGCGPGVNSDLRVHSVTAPSSANDGDYILITDVTTNCQNTACTSYSRLWLCPTSTLDTNACHFWGTHSVSALGPGGKYSVTSNKQIPVGRVGTQHIVVVCGWGGSGCEAVDKRNNNTNTTQIVVY